MMKSMIVAALVGATAAVLKKGLGLLGIPAPDRM